MNELRDAFASASAFLCDVVGATPPERFASPGVGTWSVLELIAHANRAHVTVVEYVSQPVDPATVPADYFTEASIRRRALEAVAELGDDPAGVVGRWAQRASALVAEAPADTVVGMPAGRMRLDEYVPSRIAELVVHGIDLVHALGAAPDVPVDALGATSAFLAGRAVQRGDGLQLVLGLSGRGRLAPGFSVY
jgi:uncharacterized protein (TIGR03083 family)